MQVQHKESIKVLLIGDSCVDEYVYGSVSRLSPEAPVPIFVPSRSELKDGMAANVRNNLQNLGMSVVSILGGSSRKTRLIDERSKQHMMRLDTDAVCKPLEIGSVEITPDIDAVVISDYNKGFVSYELVRYLIDTGKPVFIDTKKTDLRHFEGAFVKINEVERAACDTLPSSDRLIVTLGKNGAVWNGRSFPAENIAITDVCGAGDTFLSAFVYKYMSSHDIAKAIEFAIKAASITIQHVGVHAPTLEDIQCV